MLNQDGLWQRLVSLDDLFEGLLMPFDGTRTGSNDEGRKYSASRIRLVLTVFGEVPVFPLMPFFPPSLQPTSPLRWTHDQSPHPLQAPAR